jgi:hypothetical protein
VTRMTESLNDAVRKVAEQHPETRKHLIPLLASLESPEDSLKTLGKTLMEALDAEQSPGAKAPGIQFILKKPLVQDLYTMRITGRFAAGKYTVGALLLRQTDKLLGPKLSKSDAPEVLANQNQWVDRVSNTVFSRTTSALTHQFVNEIKQALRKASHQMRAEALKDQSEVKNLISP